MLLRRKLLSTALVCCVTASAHAQRSTRGARAEDMRTYAELLAMTDTRQLDTTLIDRALASRWQPLRAAAALAVGQVGTEHGSEGLSRLRSLLRDRDSGVAANAAYALGLLRDSASISGLSATLASNREVAREAAWAMGEIGSPARTAIITALRNAREPDVMVQLLLAAAKLRPVPLADISPFLHQGSPPPVVWAASYAIARTRSAGGVRELIQLEASPALNTEPRSAERAGENLTPYGDPQTAAPRIRAEIARGLAKSAAGDSLGPSAFAVLSRLVGDPDPHVRINAVRSLGTYGPIAKPSLVYATHDRDPNVRIAAAQSFGTVLTKQSTDFSTLLAADTSLVYQSSLLGSATRSGLRPPELAQWAASRDWRWRAAVAGAEGDTLDRAFAMSRAAALTRDPDPRVREAAYAAIIPTASMSLEDTVHALLLAGLHDPDFYVRATVIGALADHLSANDLSPVLASYSQASRDSANDARLAAIQYVAALWKRDSTAFTDARRAQLAQLAVPADPLERGAGKSVAPLDRWKNVTPSARPLAWYEGVVNTIVMPVQSGKRLTATINTVRGPIKLELFGGDAPITVWNFLSLARSGYYRNTRFHRVVPNFVAQDGDPRDDGNGGPGYAIRDEMNRHRYERGAVGMALSGPDTGGSQYFITHSPQPHLDGHYTVFGRVTGGYDVLDRLVQGDLITRVDTK
jgi:cyclophilin family peptidyl-prolyl cis-trans isomerase/HEAT repeat protein